MARAPLIEVFHSVQGEGRFVGRPMAFLRTATCPIRCRYCDTPESYAAAPGFPVRFSDGEVEEPNPVTAARAAELVQQVSARAPLSSASRPILSVTGGEPLVFPDFVRELGELLRERGYRLHLETAALDPDALGRTVTAVDHLSADYKLPETLAGHGPGGPAIDDRSDFGAEHRRCVEVAVTAGCTVDVKIVLTRDVADDSFTRALEHLARWRRDLVLVLQPVTPFGAETVAPSTTRLLEQASRASKAGFELMVLPQVHKHLELR